MHRPFLMAFVLSAAALPTASAQLLGQMVSVHPDRPGLTIGYAAEMLRTVGSERPLSDFTVGTLLSVRHARDVHQWAFGAAVEAWAMPGSRSLLVGIEAAVINEEAENDMPKVAINAVMKNRADGDPAPERAMNASSTAILVSSQPGTGFERGLVFDGNTLVSNTGRAAAIDLSDVPDDRIGEIDLIRIRRDVALRYDPVRRELVLHVDSPRAPVSSP